MTFLVVGGTGFVGNEVALKLQQRKHQVRALARGGVANAKAGHLQQAGVDIVMGDLTQPETLADACEGVETVVTTATSMPSGANDGLRRVDHDGTLALIAAAEQAGVKRFLYVSYSGNIREESPLETAKRDCENELLRGPMQAIILRPSYFMEMWLSPALGFDPGNGSARIYGSGEAKVSYISAFDVADFAAAAAIRENADKNTIMEMGGPEPLSQLDAVGVFEEVLNKKIELNFLPVEAIQQQHSSADPLQKTFGALMLAYSKGDSIEGARELAARYDISLRSVTEYATHLRTAQTQVA